MPDLRFEWDEAKIRSNKRNHGVSFEEAQTVFYDDLAILVEDEDADEEERFVFRVCQCFRENDDVIRILWVRTAERSERKVYETKWK